MKQEIKMSIFNFTKNDTNNNKNNNIARIGITTIHSGPLPDPETLY